LTLPKAALALLWLVCIAGFFVQIQTTAALVGRIAFWSLLGIHLIEFLAFRELMRGSANGFFGNFTGTLLFGMLHIQEVRAEVEEQTSGS
jgi:uncharacterized protein YhhL (DUF1145 family)